MHTEDLEAAARAAKDLDELLKKARQALAVLEGKLERLKREGRTT